MEYVVSERAIHNEPGKEAAHPGRCERSTVTPFCRIPHSIKQFAVANQVAVGVLLSQFDHLGDCRVALASERHTPSRDTPPLKVNGLARCGRLSRIDHNGPLVQPHQKFVNKASEVVRAFFRPNGARETAATSPCGSTHKYPSDPEDGLPSSQPDCLSPDVPLLLKGVWTWLTFECSRTPNTFAFERVDLPGS
ncbi:hypothetical protein AAG570_009181 [Ranatra chinensis]|uniref:Uncharacterized protein n=1 Tax=Ranatra chinensis TaxID=642074 RepID=A0ABD0YT49_9HEMI